MCVGACGWVYTCKYTITDTHVCMLWVCACVCLHLYQGMAQSSASLCRAFGPFAVGALFSMTYKVPFELICLAYVWRICLAYMSYVSGGGSSPEHDVHGAAVTAAVTATFCVGLTSLPRVRAVYRRKNAALPAATARTVYCTDGVMHVPCGYVCPAPLLSLLQRGDAQKQKTTRCTAQQSASAFWHLCTCTRWC